MSIKKSISKVSSWCNKKEWLIFLLLLVVALRLPSLFTPHYYGDEEIYFVMGRAWKTGVPLYAEMFDHKPPLIYVMAGVFSSVYLFRLALMVWMLIHTIIFWQLSQLFFDKDRAKLAYVSSLLFVVLNSLPMLEGNIVNAELMMMMPVSWALLLVWKLKNNQWKKFLIAGLVAGIGWLFKIPMMFDVLAIGLYLFAYRKKTLLESIKGIFSKSSLAFFSGFALPLASSFIYYYLKGDGASYLATVWSVNLSYVSSWETSSWAFNPFKSGLMVRGMILGVFSLGVYLIRKKLDKRVMLVMLWLGFSFFGSLLSGRPYPHYLLQPVVPLSLALPMIVMLDSVWSWSVFGYLLVWGVMTIQQIGFWWYPNKPLYTNFYKLVTHKIDKQTYVNSFDGARRNYAIAKYLNARMSKDDRLYVWGSDATVYNLTKKIPAGGKYIVNFHVEDLKKYDYVINKLYKNKPKFILLMAKTDNFSQLEEFIEADYLKTQDIGGVIIYKSIDKVLNG